jgi:hypothetical protein
MKAIGNQTHRSTEKAKHQFAQRHRPIRYQRPQQNVPYLLRLMMEMMEVRPVHLASFACMVALGM